MWTVKLRQQGFFYNPIMSAGLRIISSKVWLSTHLCFTNLEILPSPGRVSPRLHLQYRTIFKGGLCRGSAPASRVLRGNIKLSRLILRVLERFQFMTSKINSTWILQFGHNESGPSLPHKCSQVQSGLLNCIQIRFSDSSPHFMHIDCPKNLLLSSLFFRQAITSSQG